MATPFRTAVMTVSLASCVGGSGPSIAQIDEVHFSSKASFARDGYTEHFPIFNLAGEKVLEVSCYSLDDENREKFSVDTGTDPVADLSCYVKDIAREHEYTMLGIDGESLQFTPAFFWISEVNKCDPKSYRVMAKLRQIFIEFSISHIDNIKKTGDLNIIIAPMLSATNDRLTQKSFKVGCA